MVMIKRPGHRKVIEEKTTLPVTVEETTAVQ
jgi:hypothetical protein